MKASKPHQTAIVFIPGFKGSLLKNSNGRTVWVNTMSLLNPFDSLALEHPELDILNSNKLSSHSVLDKVVVIPNLITRDFYQSFFYSLKSSLDPSHELIPFHYDWRLDIPTIVNQLHDKIETLRDKYKKIILISHSLGGLIASYYLRYGTQSLKQANETWSGTHIIDKVVFAGVPFQGAIKIFRDMIFGTHMGLNRNLLSPLSLGSFQSTYYLLPSPNRKFLRNVNNEMIDQSIYDETLWKNNSWGIFSGKLSDNIIKKRSQYLSRCLENVKKFYLLQSQENFSAQSENLKVLTITSEQHLTPSSFYCHSNSSSLKPIKNQMDLCKRFNYNNRQLGDGSVSFDSSELPHAFKSFDSKNVLVSEKHTDLFKSALAQQKIIKFIQENT